MKPGNVVLGIGLFAILAMLVTILTMCGAISSLLLFKISLLAGVLSAVAGLLSGLVIRFIYRKRPPKSWGRRRALNGSQLSLIAVFIFFILAIAIPGNLTIYGLIQGRGCEKDITALGAAAEAYLTDHGRPPANLDVLVQNRYIKHIPQMEIDRPYQYRVTNNNSGFIIACPDTSRLLKDRGLLPPGQYEKIEYIQGKGLAVVTK